MVSSEIQADGSARETEELLLPVKTVESLLYVYCILKLYELIWAKYLATVLMYIVQVPLHERISVFHKNIFS